MCACRFDLKGLSPDSQEDEAGIKKAAENSEFNDFKMSRSHVVSTLVHNKIYDYITR